MEGIHPGAASATAPRALDHVALRVADVEAMVRFLSDHLGMGATEGDSGRMVVGPGGRSGKLVLSAAEGPVQAGALERVVFRVADLERAVAALPSGIRVSRPVSELAIFEGPEGLGLGLTQVLGGVDYDIDRLELNVAAPDEVALALAELGLVFRGEALHVGDKQVRVEQRPLPPPERPLLGHIAVLVDSVEAVEAQARAGGLELDSAASMPGGLTVLLPGPERLRLRFAERSIASPAS